MRLDLAGATATLDASIQLSYLNAIDDSINFLGGGLEPKSSSPSENTPGAAFGQTLYWMSVENCTLTSPTESTLQNDAGYAVQIGGTSTINSDVVNNGTLEFIGTTLTSSPEGGSSVGIQGGLDGTSVTINGRLTNGSSKDGTSTPGAEPLIKIGAGALVTVASGAEPFVNYGTIDVTNYFTAYDATGKPLLLYGRSSLIVGSQITPGILTNNGTIGALNSVVFPGSGWELTASMDNFGTVNITNGTLTLGGNDVNQVDEARGSIHLTAAILQVELSGTAYAFKNDGLIDDSVLSGLFVDPGSFDDSHGQILGGGKLILQGIVANLDPNFAISSLSTTDSSITSSAPLVIAAGQTVTLVNTTLNMNVVNTGTLVIEGAVRINGTLTSRTGSTIQVLSYPPQPNAAPVPSALTLAQGFTNTATIDLTGGQNLVVNGGTFDDTAGTIVGTGNFTFNLTLASLEPGLTLASLTASNSIVNIGQNSNVGSLSTTASTINQGDFDLNGAGVVATSADSTVNVTGDLIGDTTNVAGFTPLGPLMFNGNGTSALPQHWEAMSNDLGPAIAGFTKNFAYQTVALGANTYVKLIDAGHNSSGTEPEAVYVNSLEVPAGTTLDLNGLNLYARSMRIDGTVIGGSVRLVGVPSQIVFLQPPTSSTAGVALNSAVTVAIEDQSGNVVTTDSSTVTLTLTNGIFANGSATATAQAVNGMATFSGLTINKSGSYTLVATDGTLTSATSGAIVIAPAAANRLAIVQAPSAGITGVALAPAVKVAVEDQFGNLVASDNSTVTLTFSSGPFSSGTKTAARGGIATFSNLIFNTVGKYTLAASDGTLATTTSGAITITGPASKLVFQQAPAVTGTAGVALNPVVVAVEDKFGNAVAADSSTVTLTLSIGVFSNGSATVTAQAVHGVATFSGLTINKSGSYKLTVSDGSLTKATSGSLVISSAAASQLVFGQAPPTTWTAGVAFSPAVKVSVADQFGNIVTTNSSTITLNLSGGTFSTGSSTATAVASHGIATFSLAVNKAGAFMLTVSDGSLTAPQSSNITINPAVASKLVFQQAPPAMGTAGAALNAVIVAVEDRFGNVVAVDSSTVTLTLSSGTFANGSATVTVQAVNGLAAFSGLTINKSASYKLTASDASLTRAVSGNLVISPAPASQLVFLQVPTTGSVGVALSIVRVAVEDQFGNIVTSDNSTITISVGSGPGGLTATSTTKVKVVNGIAQFSKLILSKSGAYTLVAVDGLLNGATSNSISVM